MGINKTERWMRWVWMLSGGMLAIGGLNQWALGKPLGGEHVLLGVLAFIVGRLIGTVTKD